MSGREDKKYVIRITGQGAVTAVAQTTEVLVYISSLLKRRKITAVDELVNVLREHLSKYVAWLSSIQQASVLHSLK